MTPHLYALEKFGVKIKVKEGEYEISRNKLAPCENLIMYESGDTATENAILAAGLLKEKRLSNSLRPIIKSKICAIFGRFGVKMEGIGTTTLAIFGKENLNQEYSFQLSEDPIEAMFFDGGNRDEIVNRHKTMPVGFLELELYKLEKMGFQYKIVKEYKSENEFARLADIKHIPRN